MALASYLLSSPAAPCFGNSFVSGIFKITSGSKMTAAIDPTKLGSRNGYLDAGALNTPREKRRGRVVRHTLDCYRYCCLFCRRTTCKRGEYLPSFDVDHRKKHSWKEDGNSREKNNKPSLLKRRGDFCTGFVFG